MKNKLFIWPKVLPLLFISTLSYSQRTPLPIDSAQWVYKGFANGISDSVLIYRVKGDTIIGNKTYSKVYRANDTDTNYYSTNETLHCFIRNDTNKRAYVRYPFSYCNDTNEILLYDYNLNVGDTFNIHLLQPRPGYPCIDTSFEFIVYNRVDNVPLYSDYYGSQMYLSIIDEVTYKCWGNYCPEHMDFNLFWNEEAGSFSHMVFYNEYEYCACCGTWLYSLFHLECFWEKGKWIKGPCIITNIKEEIKPKPEIRISPNPITGISTIEIINSRIKLIKFEMFDLTGKIMNLIPLEDESVATIKINNHDYKKGYYLGKFTDVYGNSSSVKIIIL